MNMNELLRRDVIRVIGLGGAGLLVVPGAALGQSKTPFRMDETNAIHFMAGHFIPRFLSKPIEWEFKQFATSGQGRVSAFVRGAVDGIMTSWTYLVQIAFNDLPGTCLAGMAGGGSRLLLPAGSSLKSFEDLRGKRVGVVEFSFQDIQFIHACKRRGIDAFKDLTRVNLSSPAGVVAGMTSGRVDACTIFEPYGSILMVEHGATMISNLGDDSFGISNGGLYVHNDFIKKYPELTQDIVDATVKATDFVIKDKGAWIDRVRQFTGQTEAVAKLAVENCSPSLDIPIETIRKISTAMYDAGIHNRDVATTVDKFIDYSFLEKSTGKTKERLGYST
jgi:ABC-type nitrate/sulfonate/bicarbonate transport system substrate-binding protein